MGSVLDLFANQSPLLSVRSDTPLSLSAKSAAIVSRAHAYLHDESREYNQ